MSDISWIQIGSWFVKNSKWPLDKKTRLSTADRLALTLVQRDWVWMVVYDTDLWVHKKLILDPAGDTTTEANREDFGSNNIVVDDITIEKKIGSPTFEYDTSALASENIENIFGHATVTNVGYDSSWTTYSNWVFSSWTWWWSDRLYFWYNGSAIPNGSYFVWSSVDIIWDGWMFTLRGSTATAMTYVWTEAKDGWFVYEFDYDSAIHWTWSFNLNTNGASVPFDVKLCKEVDGELELTIKNIDHIIWSDGSSIDESETPMSDPDKELVTRWFVSNNNGWMSWSWSPIWSVTPPSIALIYLDTVANPKDVYLSTWLTNSDWILLS